MYKWFLILRYLHTKWIAFFGIAGVAASVALVVVVNSVMGGFLETIRERSRGLHSDIVMEGHTLQGFPYYEEFSQYLADHHADIVEVTTPSIMTYGIFRVPATAWTKPTRVLGVRFDDYVKLNRFRQGLHYETYYPGTTHLGEQQMPVVGFDPETDAVVLPEKLQNAHEAWRKSASPEEIEKYDDFPFAPCPYPEIVSSYTGDRVYAIQDGPPEWKGAPRDGLIAGTDILFTRNKTGGFDRVIARGADVAVTILPLTQRGNITGEPPISWPLRYADDSRTGIYEIDSMSVYVDFDALQQRLAMSPQQLADGGMSKPRTNQLLVGVRDGIDLDLAADEIRNAWAKFRAKLGFDIRRDDAQLIDYVEVLTWEDLQRQYIAAVEKEKILMLILFAFTGVVSAFLLFCIFYMIVEKKKRDIGIIKSLGASASGVAALFIGYAGAIGLVGATLGVNGGALFMANINRIQDALAELNPKLRVWDPSVYSFDRIPEAVDWSDTLGIAAVSVMVALVGAVLPAIYAGRVWPVEVLRYE